MSDCQHPRIGSEVKITQVDGKRWAEVRLVCSVCREPFRFSGIKVGTNTDWPTTSPDGELVRLPIEAASSTPSRLKCPECGRLLFGKSQDGSVLHRSVGVARIECGPVHVVHFRDDETVCVADGKVWSTDGEDE